MPTLTAADVAAVALILSLLSGFIHISVLIGGAGTDYALIWLPVFSLFCTMMPQPRLLALCVLHALSHTL